MIATTDLCPLLQVFDMPASVRFYRDLLGFTVETTSPVQDSDPPFDWALLRKGEAVLMLNTAYERDDRPVVPDPARIAAHGDICLYLGCPDVDGAYRLLSQQGLDIALPVTAPYGMRQLTLKDPDGYAVCLQGAVADR
ncbi:MAG: VOC family protein [Sphingomonas sp.]|jgi:catechol 2,3-dioxygenase-like lactoylglutathione lyase family enzyme|uniref:VOC family protein n=1 Tax=Sphingomonas sp. TaxID=28214 RepID=UPI003563C642